MGSVRVTKEESYSEGVVHMHSRRRTLFVPRQIICIARKLVRRDRSLLPATMNPANPLDIITLDFLIVPLVLQKIQLFVSASMQAAAKSCAVLLLEPLWLSTKQNFSFPGVYTAPKSCIMSSQDLSIRLCHLNCTRVLV